MTTNIGNITKFIVAVAGAVVTALVVVYPSTASWLPAVIAGITSALVYLVPNTPATNTTTTIPPVG